MRSRSDLEDDSRKNRDARDALHLANAGGKEANCVLAATSCDERNLNLCRVARSQFRVPRVIARLGLISDVTSWGRLNDAGMTRMNWAELVPTLLGTVTPGNALMRIAGAPNREQVADLKLLTPDIMGRTIADLILPGCDVLALKRDFLWVDDMGAAELNLGDVLTVVGTRAAVNKACESFTTL